MTSLESDVATSDNFLRFVYLKNTEISFHGLYTMETLAHIFSKIFTIIFFLVLVVIAKWEKFYISSYRINK